MRGVWRHFLLTLELNLRNRQALVYGYVVPVIFLVAFGAVFRGEVPALLGEMGQLLTITILGGACFGMPTTLVSERERGIWRRYRLLPVPAGCLVGSVLVARLIIVASAALLQVVLAHLIYGTPLPLHPAQAVAAVLLVTASFLGLGMVIAASASDVPAVQALGQCVFLPMIMIGGVGIPLSTLPSWAQRLSGFMPGRYAVDVLGRGYADERGLSSAGFSVVALLVVGVAGAVCGSRLFRWEAGRRLSGASWGWVCGALLSWALVGVYADRAGLLAQPPPPVAGYQGITEGQIASVSYDNLPGDAEFVSRLSRPFASGPSTAAVEGLRNSLRSWTPGQIADAGQSTRNLLCAAGIADVSQDPREGDMARLVFDELRGRYSDAQLQRILAWIILYPSEGACITLVPELGLNRQYREDIVRDRTVLYAKKYLGRLRGLIKERA